MISFAQFVQHGDDRICEWLDGAVEVLPPPSAKETFAREVLLESLGGFVEENSVGLLIAAPFAVRMPEEMQRAREPDLLYIPNQFAETVQANYVNSHGVALIIEICDHRTRRRDHAEKFAEYEMAGIWEYWIVDVSVQKVQCFALKFDVEQQRYRYHHAPPNADGTYSSRLFAGYTLHSASLWM
jgi:Uma2 family endonuclease